MTQIVTLTLNPALDLGAHTDRVVAGPKLRLSEPEAHPGGGGVNVSRAIAKLGGTSRALVSLGGPTGERLGTLLAEEGLDFVPILSPGETRFSLAVTDAEGEQYRFVLPGPDWDEGTLGAAVGRVDEIAAPDAYVVISGSQPPGAPAGFVTEFVRALGKGRRVVVDTSGPALVELAAGTPPAPCVLRMDGAEAEALAGHPLATRTDTADFAERLRVGGAAETVVIARGADGNVMAGPDGRCHVTAAKEPVVSAVGAGDSFVGGMVMALAAGETPDQALRHGAAAASAAVVTPGTELCRREDFNAFLPRCVITAL
ncbi:1-phosphofructokinase family hexose kinase [Citreimonas salinaria]|uniref:Phosphofructokinase n=1 Tax=Citreimonas salinaria TaxID=321339 RepID=A0A1H3F8A9_9RHOB|nr:1-phosphofructokinase family hexose kinase [Citreimonas salinaria]SDX87253.1 6-phosphofructokinase [Citreimonas salinaria]